MNDTFGRTSPRQFAEYDPDTSSWRTWPDTGLWGSTPYSGFCTGCDYSWPCQTIREVRAALAGVKP